MRPSHKANRFLLHLAILATGLSGIGALASFIVWISSDLSGLPFRFLFGFGSVGAFLLAGSRSIRTAYRETFRSFREASDDFRDSMR